jgi:hypothetical protein
MRVRAIFVLVVVWVFLVCIGSAQAANPADIYPDNKVDWLDMKIMADDWLSDGNTPADIDNSGDVNFPDFAILANNWGWIGTPPPDGMVFVYINDPGVSGHEAFYGYMSKYETTNAQYCEYLNAALAAGDVYVQTGDVYGNSGPYVDEMYYDLSSITYIDGSFYVKTTYGYYRGNLPVDKVTWYGAVAFCNHYDYRLPTEWEWQAVADYNESFTYGCGTSIDTSKANYSYDNPLNLTMYPYTSPVDYYETNGPAPYGYGMCDMAGNVWEWTDSIFSGSQRVFRGGGWDNSSRSYLTVSARYGYPPDYGHSAVGFRVCR